MEEPDDYRLGVEHSREAAEAQRKVTDLTNDLLKKNAEKLKNSNY